jgi:hypothetical protein
VSIVFLKKVLKDHKKIPLNFRQGVNELTPALPKGNIDKS